MNDDERGAGMSSDPLADRIADAMDAARVEAGVILTDTELAAAAAGAVRSSPEWQALEAADRLADYVKAHRCTGSTNVSFGGLMGCVADYRRVRGTDDGGAA